MTTVATSTADAVVQESGRGWSRWLTINRPAVHNALNAVNGVALGGGFELALACTFIVAADRASFGLPETGLDLRAGYGGTHQLPKAIGRAAALRHMLTGHRLPTGEAHIAGLLAPPPVPVGDLAAACEELRAKIASRGPLAVARVLEAVRAGAGRSRRLDHELLLVSMAAGSTEAPEGIAAFRERRTPSFPLPPLPPRPPSPLGGEQ